MPFKNPEDKKRWNQKNYLLNRDKILSGQKDYRAKSLEKRRVWWKSRVSKDVGFKLKSQLRHRIFKALKGICKSTHTLELLDMDLPEFKIYIQGQFRPGMTWDNYGPVWHIDHIRPCVSFDLTNSEQQKICFRWDNLQPLFALENLKKGGRHAG